MKGKRTRAVKICPQCGAPHADYLESCGTCGTSLKETAPTEQPEVLRLTRRNPWKVLLLGLITLGIYNLYWLVVTKRAMVDGGADIPSAWFIAAWFLPVFGWLIALFWEWKFCGGVEWVTDGEMSTIVAFLLLIFLGAIGMAIIQSKLNKVAT